MASLGHSLGATNGKIEEAVTRFTVTFSTDGTSFTRPGSIVATIGAVRVFTNNACSFISPFSNVDSRLAGTTCEA